MNRTEWKSAYSQLRKTLRDKRSIESAQIYFTHNGRPATATLRRPIRLLSPYHGIYNGLRITKSTIIDRSIHERWAEQMRYVSAERNLVLVGRSRHPSDRAIYRSAIQQARELRTA